MKIVFPDPIKLHTEQNNKLKEMGVVMHADMPTTNEAIKERIADAEIVTANYLEFTAEVIDLAPKLKFIISPAVGFDWIDVKYARSKGISVINCPTFNSQAVAEHAMGLLFAVARHIVASAVQLRAGTWDPKSMTGMELAGKQLGLVGYGNIGRRLEKIASGLGMSVRFVNSKSSPKEVDNLLASSDVVVLCAPLTDDTRGILSADRIKSLRPQSYVINVARGGLVDQDALFEALSSQKIAGAGLDVFADEPLIGVPNEKILALAKLPNVVATPHNAYNTEEAVERLGMELAQNIEACLAGAPINVIN